MADRLIYESVKSKVYLQQHADAQTPVAIKELNYEFPSPRDIEQFYNEFHVLQNLNLTRTRKVLQKQRDKNRHLIYLEWIEGTSLREAYKNKATDLFPFLQIAINLCDAIAEIHQHHIIHKDINPGNILIDTTGNRVTLIDFCISSTFDLKQQFIANPDLVKGTLAYVSPEQTGRMNRLVDYRTDLYSMGATFFELLTGTLPFAEKDALEMVHAHIAKVPKPANEINQQIPPQIGKIVSKLLAKNAEDRYQSALGVKADLKKCLDEYVQSGTISDFPIGQEDFTNNFLLPQKLYGREQEISAIIEAFDRCASGSLELLLVSGFSGTGKSAIVHEVHKPITTNRGYFISGKYDQFQRSEPYFALIASFKSLVNIFLTEKEEKLQYFREKLKAALGSEGQVIVDVIPALEYIIGKQPPLTQLGGLEAQKRFTYVFRKFVKAVANQSNPIVLFIDDLQWADSASLNLLESLLQDKDIKHLLVIGAYRINEVGPTHPLMHTLGVVGKAGIPVGIKQIDNLEIHHLHSLIADALGTGLPQMQELTALVYEKTKGNAFFLTQFLKSLHDKGFLRFDAGTKSWSCDIALIRATNMTDNVVELMAEKIRTLAPNTQNLLTLAACIGNQFDLATLSVISGRDAETLRSDLLEALSEGILIPTDDGYKFAHDRIQQSAYSLIADNEKAATHLQIGRLLLQNTDHDKQEARLFDITDHCNQGMALMEAGEKMQLLELNRKAAIRAKNTSAFQHARTYIEHALALLPNEAWKTNYERTLDLFTLAADIAYLCSNIAGMESYIDEITKHAVDAKDTVKANEIRIQGYISQNRLSESLATGLEVLNHFDITFPKNPTLAHAVAALVKTKLVMGLRKPADLIDLPMMQPGRHLEAMSVLFEVLPSAYWVNANLMLMVVFKMMRMSLQKGNCGISYYSYTSYGAVLCELGSLKTGYEIGSIGLQLSDREEARATSCRIKFNFSCFVQHWCEPLQNTLDPFLKSYHIGLETGNGEFASFSLYFYMQHFYLAGRNLQEAIAGFEKYGNAIRQMGHFTPYNYLAMHHQAALNLTGLSPDPCALEGDAYRESEMLPMHEKGNDKTALYKYHFQKMILQTLFERYDDAIQSGEKALPNVGSVTAQYCRTLILFYEALARLGHYRKVNAATQRQYGKRIKQNIAKIKMWATHSPENQLHKYHLLMAEWGRVQGNHSKVLDHYDLAIQLSRKAGFLQEEALANELTGKYFLEREKGDLAEMYLKNAWQCYRSWGAEAKLAHLHQFYPQYISGIMRKTSGLRMSGTNETQGTGTNTSGLDMASVLKASTTISGEVVLSKLLSLLMRIMVENAGAQRAFFLLQRNGELFIEAEVETDEEAKAMFHQPFAQGDTLAESVVTYVSRTKEYIVLDDAVSDPRFQTDAYIQQHKPVSLLCMPIIHLGEFIGLLYLENNLAKGAFSEGRLQVLQLLSGQIAVSIYNALLYEQLEQKVEERTAELALEKKKSDDLLYNILPFETAQELKKFGKAEAKQFKSVTVLFTDFVSFTSTAEKLSPAELVVEIDECFQAFDNIAEKHGIEKIKTIGDCYMAAGGIPVPNNTHAENIVAAAIEFVEFINHRNKQGARVPLELRIGISSGSVVAGVVGHKKFQYDIWGDTVNTAARMEQNSQPGKINISESTYQLIKDKYTCENRGEIYAKGKGNVNMYFVVGGKIERYRDGI
jgi:predicted ATPase/class 3 adenylate cyclase